MRNWYETLAEDDFARARTRELLSRVSGFLDPARGRLLPLEEVRSLLRPSAEHYLGIKAVPIDLIVGSEGRYRDFNRHFLPRSERLKSRWTRIDQAHYAEIPLPPVRLYEIGGLYFVRDGNHRVSVARLRGQGHVDAEVTSLGTALKLRPGMTLEELKRSLIGFEKERFYASLDFGGLTGEEKLDFTSPGRYDEILEHILVHKYFINQGRNGEISLSDALFSWYGNVYQPVAAAIEELGILSRFPDRTVADLYVFIVRHWDELKRKYGLSYGIADAALDYSARFGSSRLRRLLAGFFRRLRHLVDRLR